MNVRVLDDKTLAASFDETHLEVGYSCDHRLCNGYMGFSINMGEKIAGLFIMENIYGTSDLDDLGVSPF